MEWIVLNEQAIGQKQSLDEWVFDKGVRDPWTLYIGDDFDWSVRSVRAGRSQVEELNLSVVDREVQEDARRVEFTGTGKHLSQVFFPI
ncbi:MAG: hypothetical protein CM15mP103_03740 [Gammaproteobacteria bacterium]|nr:MAG: hypothetical protein CM15mP103_03740 [Gammaproteobacteria bacterium]